MPDSVLASHPRIAPLLTDRPQRARLLEAMVRAVAEKGYEAATVADAVRLAKVSRGTFYELFSSKEACLLAAYQAGYEVLEQRTTRRFGTPPTGGWNFAWGSARICACSARTRCSRGST